MCIRDSYEGSAKISIKNIESRLIQVYFLGMTLHYAVFRDHIKCRTVKHENHETKHEKLPEKYSIDVNIRTV